MQPSSILSCQVSSWYPLFGHLSFKSTVLDLPQEFVTFLVQDGVFFPEGSSALPKRAAQDPYDDDYTEWDEESEPQNAGQEDDIQVPEFKNLSAAMEAAIHELGGKVAPKFTWSSPHDATWVSGSHSLSCGSPDEVLLLLKSSDRVMHDICHAFDACPAPPNEPVRHALMLRKWMALKPERELRCFVRQHDFIAISQRNILEPPDGLQSQEDELREMLLEFFEEHLQEQFPEANYTFDVYITTSGKIRLLDFNPIGGANSPLLYTWEELGYHLGSPSDQHESDQPQSASAEPHLAQLDSEPSPEDHEPYAGSSWPASRQNERMHEANSHSMKVQADSAAAPSGDTLQHAGHAVSAGTVNGNGHGHGHGTGSSAEHAEILVRFAEPGSSMFRPASALYGAPYDMADLSEGSAISEMLRKMQTQENEEPQVQVQEGRGEES